jgi:hypothetical protein
MDYQGVFHIKCALPDLGDREVRHARLWEQGVVCIKCGSVWGGTYTRIPDMYPAGVVKVVI